MKTNIVKNVKAGFSLVEMLVVIAVIGIIAAIAVPTIVGNITSQADTAKAQRNAQNLASVAASAVAAGATGLSAANEGEIAAVVTLLVGGVNGSAAAGFDTTTFRVPNLSAGVGGEQESAIDYLVHDASVGIIYAPDKP